MFSIYSPFYLSYTRQAQGIKVAAKVNEYLLLKEIVYLN